MKEIKESVGIDASKDKLDVQLHVKNESAQFSNNKSGFKKLVHWVKKQTGQESSAIMFCFEHTGIYTMCLASFLTDQKLPFAMVPALQIKRSLGMVRGKNDQVDAKRIAEYCYLRRDSIKQTVLPSPVILKIKALLSLRERMVKQSAGYQAALSEMKIAFSPAENPELFKLQEAANTQLEDSIKIIDKRIQKLIKEHDDIKQLYKLIISVKGIGPVIAANLIVVTNCFTYFENSRQLGCYCGIAPFEKQSGTSIKSKSKVSHYANKKMKTLITLAAFNVINTDSELKTYYNRRLAEGKTEMSTINIIRNKLLSRVFAVVKRGTPYVEIQKWAA